MDRHASAKNTGAALRLAVDWFLVTEAGMIFQTLSRELDVAEFAESPAKCACEGQMIGHHHPRDLSVAHIWAWRCVKLACVQVGLDGEFKISFVEHL